jgi:hypothetical protein
LRKSLTLILTLSALALWACGGADRGTGTTLTPNEAPIPTPMSSALTLTGDTDAVQIAQLPYTADFLVEFTAKTQRPVFGCSLSSGIELTAPGGGSRWVSLDVMTNDGDSTPASGRPNRSSRSSRVRSTSRPTTPGRGS